MFEDNAPSSTLLLAVLRFVLEIALGSCEVRFFALVVDSTVARWSCRLPLDLTAQKVFNIL